MSPIAGLPANAFDKLDRQPDAAFYAPPRFVAHLDDRAIAAVTGLYSSLFSAGGVILDVMSSWISHLPDDVAYAAVVGHGMNAAELAANPRLTRTFVQDLNADPTLPLDDASFDGAGLCASIQYLQRPIEVLGEVRRALKPGAPLCITFSNRCFPTKAVAIWRALAGGEQARLVSLYLHDAGFEAVETRDVLPTLGGDPLWAVIGRAPAA